MRAILGIVVLLVVLLLLLFWRIPPTWVLFPLVVGFLGVSFRWSFAPLLTLVLLGGCLFATPPLQFRSDDGPPIIVGSMTPPGPRPERHR